jgi:hypothetical protein
MNDREIMMQALDALIRYEIDADGEWGECRSMCQIDADGDTPPIITALRERLAQPEQEPVVFYRCKGCGHAYEQMHPTRCDCMASEGFDRLEYYTTPPAAQRQPLTDEWIHRTTVLMGFNPEWTTEIGIAHAIVRAAEAAHGIKENT